MTKQQFIAITQWQRETFKSSSSLSKIAHLADELQELVLELKAPIRDVEKVRAEFADCFILLFGAADAAGMIYGQILEAIDKKHAINKNRRWGTPDASGVVNHIKESDKP